MTRRTRSDIQDNFLRSLLLICLEAGHFDGEWKWYRENGNLMQIGSFEAGVRRKSFASSISILVEV
jgi:antitoxin component YwqK of YwqJK toxin-antitoxin module